MAVVSDGKGAAEVVVLAPPSELLGSCLTGYDWLNRWNRLRVYHPPGESKKQAKASCRIERLLYRAMKDHFLDADPAAANAALRKAFGKKMMQRLEAENAEDTEVDGSRRLEITDVRPLDADEQEQVRDQVPAKWLLMIQDSGRFMNCIEIEGQALRERTEGFWRRPGLCKRLGIAGAATASGLAIAGLLLLYHFGRRSGSRFPRMAPRPPIYSSSVSDTTAYSSSPSGTADSDHTTTSSTLFTTRLPSSTHNQLDAYEAEAEKYQRALAHDCLVTSEFDVVNQCHPNPEKRPEPSIDDITTLLSGYELATLRVPDGTCNDALHRMKPQSMVKAAPGGWKALDWSQVNGGKVVCTDENGQDVTCHYFGEPFKYDLPTVWDAVNHYLKPYQCLFTENQKDPGQELEYKGGRARGIAKWLGADIYGFAGWDLWRVGYMAETLNEGANTRTQYGRQVIPTSYCDSNGPTCRTNLSEYCQCDMIEMSTVATTPSGTTIRWGSVKDYFTNQTELAKHYTLFQRKEYKLTNCRIKCYRHPDPEEHLRASRTYWEGAFGQTL
ncbi:putative transmembrane protein [Gregarina niphandrodes]|uniref:Transmembrane protein n=1 Tax=Gregarina niphandrodes TaxID=110365 RepID=A0A023AYS0_GRENI|nr:putative transmembrane protein [Gregarina niphandrodes]EZG43420.1 putative transmembrane protein [Gregarina niphandrodes]|eukprot:XP_011133361.1 putative transmembrane protein [Gregarina niphandrodes]